MKRSGGGGGGQSSGRATCTAGVNIAVIKYWGKSDERLILPINSSLSVTLNQADLCTTTSAVFSADFQTDRLWLNGQEESLSSRTLACLSELRALAAAAQDSSCSSSSIKKKSKSGNGVDEKTTTTTDLATMKVHIVSENNFPTAAGLASSAAGFACLVFTVATALGLTDTVSHECLSRIARQGSGSACRSLFGGFVAWDMGSDKATGSDSQARLVQPHTHWPELHILVLVVNDEKKHTSSTDGMKTSVETSQLLAHRAASVVPDRMKQMEAAIASKDFATFAKLTMQDSNQFHACCLDTYPPITYLNDTSRSIIRICTGLNSSSADHNPIVAYTFDAGPNAVLYLLEENIRPVLTAILQHFPATGIENYFRNLESKYLPDSSATATSASIITPAKSPLKYILHTTAGPGPIVLDDDKCSLIDKVTGLPKKCK